MNIIQDNILNTDCEYIIQQCNCLTVRSHGLSKTLEDHFPHAKLYEKRRAIGNRNLAVPEDRSTPGSGIILEGNPKIVCLFGQWRPGKVNTSYFHSYPEYSIPETEEQRKIWFKQALFGFGNQLRDNQANKVKIAVPYNIGCGLAGGDWDDYSRMILEFQQEYEKETDVYVYKHK